jgi:hypothetical protein
MSRFCLLPRKATPLSRARIQAVVLEHLPRCYVYVLSLHMQFVAASSVF